MAPAPLLTESDRDRLFFFGPHERMWKVVSVRGNRAFCMDVGSAEGCDLPAAEVRRLLDEYEKQKVTEYPPY